ncbi:hypothetical protein [Paenibacillus sp. FSL R5-0470]|uniref:hypothetical protein n=1 Tax=Paenibacillus sp. FSL R5-0470 TaxID=2921641 RepID=UPI0030D841A6
MKKNYSFLTLSLLILISLISPSSTFAATKSPEEQISRTIENFYTSLNTQDKELYLTVIANSSKPEFIYAADHLVPTQINYTIINLEKIAETKYIANILVEKNGTSYPLFPYEVQLEQDGLWKINTNSFLVTPKVNSEGISSDAIFSENDSFIVQRNDNNSEELAARGTLSYSFNEYSTHIWLAGSGTVYVFPSPSDVDVVITIYGVSSEYPLYSDVEYVNPARTGSNYATFSQLLHGYYFFNAVPTVSVPGYYMVSY